MIHEQIYTVNISPNKGKTIVDLNQNENGRRLTFILVGDDKIHVPTGTTATILGTKPNGDVYSAEGIVDATNRTATFQENQQLTILPGKWDAKLQLIYAGETIATSRLQFRVDGDVVEPDAIPTDTVLEGILAEVKHYAEEAKSESYGAPLIASSSEDMTDRNRVYVYIGNEEGYDAGYWYYFDPSEGEWVIGGSYNAVDETLAQVGHAADARAVGEALETKVDKIPGMGLSTEDYSTAEKAKLAAIEPGSTRVLVDPSVSDASTNPVQNKVIKAYVDSGDETDKTLTLPNRPADAKATGDAIAKEISDRAADVAAEATARNTQITSAASSIRSALNAEISARESAVSAEASARATAVNNERSAREAAIADLQNQIDGNITSYFYTVDPKLTNEPASTWSSDAIRDVHLGDLYYNTETGYMWRWQKVSGVYSWQRIADTDISRALADISTINNDITQMNNRLARKADKTEVPSKVSDLYNDSGFVNGSYVGDAISSNIDTSLRVAGKSADAKETGDRLNGKVDKISGKGLSSNDFTDSAQTKLAGISDGATRVIVDYSMVSGSANPVQSRVIKAYVDSELSAVATNLQNQISHFTEPTIRVDIVDGNF